MPFLNKQKNNNNYLSTVVFLILAKKDQENLLNYDILTKFGNFQLIKL